MNRTILMLSVMAAATATAAAAGLTMAETTYADEPTTVKSAAITHVFDGHETWVPFTDGMTVDSDTRKFKGTVSNLTTVQVWLNDTKIGMSDITKPPNYFAKQTKDPLPPGTYQLVVMDCGDIVKGNRGECAVRGADLTEYDVLFRGTMTIMSSAMHEMKKMETKYVEMESEMKTMMDEMHDLRQQILNHKNGMDGRDAVVTDKTAYKLGEPIYFLYDGPCIENTFATLWPDTLYDEYGVSVHVDCENRERPYSPYGHGDAYYEDGTGYGWITWHTEDAGSNATSWTLEVNEGFVSYDPETGWENRPLAEPSEPFTISFD